MGNCGLWELVCITYFIRRLYEISAWGLTFNSLCDILCVGASIEVERNKPMVSRVDQYKRQGRQIAHRLYESPKRGICVDCNKIAMVEMHHIDNNTHNNDPENVVFLCHRCHLRRHRKRGDVGSRSKLTKAQIAKIKDKSVNLSEYARDLGMCRSYLQRIRVGDKNPIPIDARVSLSIPTGWEYKDLRGKPRALTVAQVKEILRPQPTLGTKKALEFTKSFNCSIATIYKARMRRACYADSIYD